jgi:ankyrin repeat protein
MNTSVALQNEILDSPLLHALKRGQTAVAQELLTHPDTDITKRDSHGLLAIHWACFLRQTEVIKLLLSKQTPLNQGPLPSELYEIAPENGPIIFQHYSDKPHQHKAHSYSACIADTILHLPEICANLNWTSETNLASSFWKGREQIKIDPLILLELKKVPPSLHAANQRFFKDSQKNTAQHQLHQHKPKHS